MADVACEQKRCTKCCEEKPLDSFYVKQVRPSGHVTKDSKCKACAKDRNAKRRAVREGRKYKKREGQIPKHCECGTEINQQQVKCRPCRVAHRYGMTKAGYQQALEEHGEAWFKALTKARSKAIGKANRRMDHRSDPWRMKFSAVITGMRNRIKYEQLKDLPKKHVTEKVQPRTWEDALARDFCRLRQLSKARRKRRDDPWYAKFQTTTRNWRRKLGDGRRSRPAQPTREAKSQMRFEWQGSNA